MKRALSAVSVLLLVCLCGCGARQAVPQVPDWSGSSGEVGFEESGFLSEPVPTFSEARSEESETASFTPPESKVSAHSETPPVESKAEPASEAPPIESVEDSSEPVESEAPPVSETPTPTPPQTEPPSVAPEPPQPEPPSEVPTPPQPEPPSEAPEPPQPEPPSETPVESEPEQHIHSYIETVVPPSCTEQGYTQHRCKCGDCYKDCFVPATGHSWEYRQCLKEPTEEEEGTEQWWCPKCGAVEERSCPKLVFHHLDANDVEIICNHIIEELNAERAKLGAPPLSTAPIAHEMAMVRAQELTIKFSHTRPDGSDSSTIYLEYQYNKDRHDGFVPYKGQMVQDTSPYGSEDIGYVGGVDNGDLFPVDEEERAWELRNTAKMMVHIFYSSKDRTGHWKDLMNPEYTGVGIGYAYDKAACREYVAVLTMDKTYG